MDAITKPHHSLSSTLSLSLPLRRRRLSAPFTSLSLSSSSPPPPKLSLSTRATSSPSPSPSPNLSLLKTTAAAAVAAAAVFLSRLSLSLPLRLSPSLPALASSSSLIDDVAELKGKMEANIKEGKVEEAIGIVEKLIGIEPDDVEWPLMRAHLYCYNGNLEMARLGFDEMLQKDPTRVEAFHGLVMAASEGDSGEQQLKDIEKRVQEAMEICKRENRKKDDLRDFKLLIAQIRVIEGNYNDALKVYQDLVEEEPRDFRPYLCQGIIYTMLKKTDEAEKQFEKYRRLVPKGHPYAQYFDDNMIATKVFGQKEEREATRS